MEGMLIGAVARAAAVNIETVRFYEREGLIAHPPRTQSKYRKYPSSVVPRIRFIRRAKDLGFTLDEIRDLLALRDRTDGCADVRERAEKKIAAIGERVAALQRMQAGLAELARTCAEGPDDTRCPILNALEEDADAAD